MVFGFAYSFKNKTEYYANYPIKNNRIHNRRICW